MKRLLKSKRGMTLMEILVALSLLMIVIVGTTPVMLSAYDSLYTAGEYTQDTYEAKSEIEEKLATRNSRDNYSGFSVNFDLGENYSNLGEVAIVSGKRALSSLYGSLETLFTNARVRVAIISSKTVNDDYACVATCTYNGGENTPPHEADCGWHEVVLQTTNLDFGTTNPAIAQAHLSLNTTGNIIDGGKIVDGYLKKIDITFMIPDKRTNTPDAQIYTSNALANVDYSNITVEPITGRITVRINGFDFTQSPIKISVAYLDENDKRQTTETYLYVEQPTIIAAGGTTKSDYYTSPGVVVKTVSNKNALTGEITKTEETSFNLYGRTMRINETNSTGSYTTYTDPLHSSTVRIKSGTSAIKDGTVIKSVNWVDNDTTTNSVGPYYVLTGTNGAIYRVYPLTGTNTTLTNLIQPEDKEIYIRDGFSSKTIYPSLWGGDKAHQFGYSTYGKSMVYKYSNASGVDKDNGCWYTESGRNTGVGHASANAYSTSAEYSYYYNGWGQTYYYMSQKSRKISYILTEHGLSLRLGGLLFGEYDHHINYNLMWENLNNIEYPTDENNKENYKKNTDWTDDGWKRRIFYHPTYGSDVMTAVWGSDKTSNYQSQDCPLYFDDYGESDGGDRFADIYWGNIRIKYLSNMPLDYFHASGRRGNYQDGQSSSVRFLQHETWNGYKVYDPKITVTDAIYLPALGSMFYVGTVAADAYLQQNDNLANKDWVDRYKYEPKDNHGAITTYFVRGNDDGTATEVHKYSYQSMAYGDYDFEWDHYTALVTNYYLAGKATMTEAKTSDSGNAAEAFYVTRPNTTASKLFTDVSFTLGFSSNREFVYSEIVYGMVDADDDGSRDDLKENYKSYEHYYFKSHYEGNTKHIPNAAIVNNNGNSTLYSQTAGYLNKDNNDYYNVWFPGEMYNITHVATKDGITVGTGYTVSGSTYQFVLGTKHENTSTALGGIFNDGVLACSIDDNETSFENLLYYKDNISFDSSSLSNTAGYKTAYPNGYGTHSRDSVQFIAVDIGVQYITSGTISTNDTGDTNDTGGTSTATETADYYAYYADNKGRLFRSKIATRESGSATPIKVEYISDELTEEEVTETNEDGTTTTKNKKVFYTPSTVPTSVPPKNEGDDPFIGYMEQIKFSDGSDFSDYFDKITTIKCEGKYIIVAGHSNSGVNKWNAAIGEIQDDGTVVFNHVSLDATDTQTYVVEDVLIQDGYVYFAGVWTADNSGFIYVHSLADMASEAQDDGIIDFADGFFVGVPDPLYAIAGK